MYEQTRKAAAELLERLGSPDPEVLTAADRSPVWPDGFGGAITHTDRLIGVAAFRKGDILGIGIGIDIEEIVSPSAAIDINAVCMRQEERQSLNDYAGLSFETYATICFSAKETLFKCLYPLTGVFFDFLDARIDKIDVDAGVCEATLLIDLSPEMPRGRTFPINFACRAANIFTSIQLLATDLQPGPESQGTSVQRGS